MELGHNAMAALVVQRKCYIDNYARPRSKESLVWRNRFKVVGAAISCEYFKHVEMTVQNSERKAAFVSIC
eukprot:scaffold487820_cov36-Prasinocladus_malaysianus.AAC.1